MPRLSLAALLCACLALPAGADDRAAPSPAQAGYDYAQTVRNEVSTQLKDKSDRVALEQAAQRLEGLVDWLDTPLTRDLGTGSRYLYFRGLDVQRDLAVVYARLGQTDKALDALENMGRYGWFGDATEPMLADEAFAALREEPRFQAIRATWSTPLRMLKDFGAGSTYRERLTVEERIAGLTQFWADARQYFAHFDNAPALDWNQAYLEFLPRVIAADTTAAYYQVLMQFAPLLRDGHTNIFPPDQLKNRLYARPPIMTALVEDAVLVIAVHDPALAAGLRVGDEIVAIDGMPVKQYAEQKVAPYVSSSTAQDRALRMYSYQLLTGDAGVPVRLTLRDGTGRQREETIARGSADAPGKREPFAFRMLPGDIAYLSLDHFESDGGVIAFAMHAPQIMRAKGLILDVRGNGGGSTAHGESILQRLTNQPIPRALSFVRGPSIASTESSRTLTWEPMPAIAPARNQFGKVFAGPVVVLTSEQTFSAAEDFVLAFNALERGTTIGATTAGSTGQPIGIKLPGGGWGRICYKRDLLPDGGKLVGRGLAPDIEAFPTVKSVRAGTDPVLQRALATFRR